MTEKNCNWLKLRKTGRTTEEVGLAETESYGKSSAAPVPSRPGLAANLIMVGFITLAVLAASLALLLE